MLRTPLRAVLGVLVLLGLGCGQDDETRLGYQISLHVFGTAAAFEGRELTVNGKPIVLRDRVGADQVQARIILCTADRRRFVESPLLVKVRKGDGEVVETRVDRFACRLSPNGGSKEQATVLLQEDGRIAADFENDARLETYCIQGRQPLCPADDF